MKLLAIDTSTEQASVAVSFGDELLHQEQGAQRTHAQFLLPMIDELLAKANIPMNQLDGIIFGCGPGSFTGLRIACSTAKGLAYAHDLELIPVSSLAAIAWRARQQTAQADTAVLAVLDARMHEMYWAYYPQAQYVAEERVNAVAKISVPTQQPIVLAGVGIDEYWADFSDTLKAQVSNRLSVYPNAAAMIELARAKNLPAIHVADAQPVYVRNQVTYDKNS
ncbi:tRNA (adenosine(37)-N6)-threonylcarbamoyltransferase complex dimerization subunit type 1 TsaB [Legionella rowbothamii]|uniref:tRNA (adenosine(37)-N6)-threonylcarbamoyltransferase complex dimerization subunit type 1 TsaB n=1 Tax=Legionella rowbothamii TaxID=96229 RepID=UPI00105604DA|nr:tRNA (adenosine(37)-N6)-threonylcarbamoyltransferase complex dimerization subunit type 1 TsaB [Legionella rowbothamii]